MENYRDRDGVSPSRLRYKFINSQQHTISFETGRYTFDRLDTHAQVPRRFSPCLTCHLHVDTEPFAHICRDRNTRGAHARDQTVGNNDEPLPRWLCNACYYLHSLSRRDEHPRTRSLQAGVLRRRRKEKKKKSAPGVEVCVERKESG